MEKVGADARQQLDLIARGPVAGEFRSPLLGFVVCAAAGPAARS